MSQRAINKCGTVCKTKGGKRRSGELSRWQVAGGEPDAMTSASSSNGSRCGHVAWGMANGSAAVAPSQSRPSNRARPGLQHADNTLTHTHTRASTHVLSYSHYSCSCRKLQATFTFVPILFLFRVQFCRRVQGQVKGLPKEKVVGERGGG